MMFCQDSELLWVCGLRSMRGQPLRLHWKDGQHISGPYPCGAGNAVNPVSFIVIPFWRAEIDVANICLLGQLGMILAVYQHVACDASSSETASPGCQLMTVCDTASESTDHLMGMPYLGRSQVEHNGHSLGLCNAPADCIRHLECRTSSSWSHCLVFTSTFTSCCLS